MYTSTLRKVIFSSCFLIFSSLAHATPIMELRLDTMLAKAGELKKDLNLNANQQLLWQQTENKLNAIQHQREKRRERLQAELELRLEQNNIELRDLSPQIEQEDQSTVQENKQMRELVLILNDALDDKQRQSMQMLMASYLRATAEVGKARRQDSTDAPQRKAGMGRQRGGGGNGENKF
ncbi:hypothetical protein ACO0LF_02665 [Undibacterium sp. Di27W]|uniref:hypothetical protein n=1 Tax=Undibacterium sp. Di27W TaxID=3413036 RepID=UPI003BF12B07